MLFTCQQRHCVSSQFTTDYFLIFISKTWINSSIPSPAAFCKADSITSIIALFNKLFSKATNFILYLSSNTATFSLKHTCWRN